MRSLSILILAVAVVGLACLGCGRTGQCRGPSHPGKCSAEACGHFVDKDGDKSCDLAKACHSEVKAADGCPCRGRGCGPKNAQ